jgi:hypothetical protein
MSYVENLTIRFDSKDEMQKAQELCEDCPLNLDCGGPDEKLNGAAINDSIGFKATDEIIVLEASCLKQK